MPFGKPIATGNTAHIYLHNGKIIKLFNDFCPATESQHEANKQKYAYSCGLPVPCIYDVVKLDGKQAIIMEYVEGSTIGDLMYADMTKATQYMSLSVSMQMKIHAIKADHIEWMTDKLNRQILMAPLLNDRQKAFLIDRLQAIPYEKRLCHGDYHIFNLIQTNTGVKIIDWVDASAGCINADVYRTYLLYSQFSMDLANLYLQLYCKHSGVSQDAIFMWEPIVAGARLSENVSSEKAERLVDIVRQYCSETSQ